MGEFVARLTFDDFPDQAIETVRRAFFDTVRVTLAGSVEGMERRAFETANIGLTVAGTRTPLGVDRARSPESTALRSGTASHILDYDDLSWAIDGHPSITLVPAYLALADEVLRGKRRPMYLLPLFFIHYTQEWWSETRSN